MRVLFLDLDTLRPDHLGCYGYQRNTSPNIDAIAGQGVRFNNYYCSDAPCLPARAALMSGQFGIHTGCINHGGVNADFRIEGHTRGFRDRLAYHSIPALLRSEGMKTAMISPFGERHAAWWFYAGFSEMYNTGKGGMESAEEISPTVLDWVKRNASEDNWYLHINYWDPHTPYRAPEGFANPFKDDPIPAWMNQEIIDKHNNLPGGHSSRDIAMFNNRENPQYPRQPGEVRDMDGFRRMIDGYDCGIKYMDDHIGRLFDTLDAQGALDDTVIIISSDHGENLGEINSYAEHGTSDYITHHIPMIIRWPGKGQSGHVDNGFHYNLDLLPTLAEMLGKERAPHWDGTSYSPALLNGEECGHDSLILSQCCHGCQRSVRFGDYQYIRTYHDFYHLYPREMLFNVAEDPHETNNLAKEKPEVCAEATHKYMDWHDTMMASSAHASDPLWEVIRDGGPFHARGNLPVYSKWLEESDRGWAIPELKKRYPGEFRGRGVSPV